MSTHSPRGTGTGSSAANAARRAEDTGWTPPPIDMTKVSAARIYDYLLGGKDNFEIDRTAAQELLSVAPYARDLARANRLFLHRAVEHVVRDLGVRQLIDLGTGIPTSPSVHETARSCTPEVRVLYLDNDPVVHAHNRAILATEPATVTLLRDLREPETVVDDPRVREFVDFTQPVGLLFVAVLHFVSYDQAPALMARYRSALAPGSCVAVSTGCRDGGDPETLRIAESMYDNSDSSLYLRTTAQIEQLFEGLRLAEPLADVTRWRNPGGAPMASQCLAGVGIKD